MFWKLTPVAASNASEECKITPEGRYVIHRHRDSEGPHLDLRLEQPGYLAGWRVEGLSLQEPRWATEKMPHPLTWLEQDGEAVREEDGVYVWRDRHDHGGVLELRGRQGVRRMEIERLPGLPLQCIRAIAEALQEESMEPGAAAHLIRDGAAARRRAIERCCGLSRELDGALFNETAWRKMLGGCTLQEIGTYLEGLEVRFDRAYPPAPLSQPESLPDVQETGRTGQAFEIVLR